MTEPNTEKDIRPIHRYITTHTDNGTPAFSNDVPSAAPFKTLPEGAEFALCYATNEFPVEFSGQKDVSTYKNYMTSLPGITIDSGSVLRVVDMPPGALSPMHRTISLDYGVVLEGDVELVLDSGESRLLHRGDMTIQRGTNHAWRNMSKTGWARMLYVLLPAKPLVFDGKTLDDNSEETISSFR